MNRTARLAGILTTCHTLIKGHRSKNVETRQFPPTVHGLMWPFLRSFVLLPPPPVRPILFIFAVTQETRGVCHPEQREGSWSPVFDFELHFRCCCNNDL